MLFEIVHRTDYRYSQPATEACIEARLTLPTLPTQSIVQQSLEIVPTVGLSGYRDPFGNEVCFFSLAQRHERLSLTLKARVRTHEVSAPTEALGTSVAEARQILSSQLTDIFEYLQPTPAVPTGGPATQWVKKYFRGGRPLGDAIFEACQAIHRKFAYRPGVTENSTPLAEVWRRREGVCQDFAHILLSILRTAGVPSRYVCGYIESGNPEDGGLLGSMATHAWVEAMLPGLIWVGLDPTNDQWCGTRHVVVSHGRDYADAAPVRGTFKGSGTQSLRAKVSMKRISEKP
ncbi:MAG: transglutaminase family protein [Terrimicrobiaceae bacterium]